MPGRLKIAGWIGAVLCSVASASACDWPQLLGPDRNGVAADEVVRGEFPADGPHRHWKRSVGSGYAGPVVVDGQLVLFHRVGDRDVVECLDAATAGGVWEFSYETDYRDDFGFDDGPRAVPTVSGGRVYTYGAQGMLHCLDFKTGEKKWSVDTRATLGSRKGFFGRACSPLVEGGRVMLNVGGADGAGIVAFDAAGGAVVWRATDDEAGYASPVAATLGGQRYGLFFTRTGLVALDPADGRVLIQRRFRSSIHASVNAANPVVIGDRVLLSASYGTGAALLRFNGDKAEPVWTSDDAMSGHYATPVYHDGFLYGFHGRVDLGSGASLRCVETQTGRVRWQTEPLGGGAVLLAGDRLLVLTQDGRLIVAPASPDRFDPSSDAQVLGRDTRAQPALSHGFLYARDKRQLIRLDLRPAP